MNNRKLIIFPALVAAVSAILAVAVLSMERPGQTVQETKTVSTTTGDTNDASAATDAQDGETMGGAAGQVSDPASNVGIEDQAIKQLMSSVKYGAEDATIANCPIALPAAMSVIMARGWQVMPDAMLNAVSESGFVAPARVSYCDVDLEKSPYTVVVAQYQNEKFLDEAIRGLATNDGMLFLGVPSTLSATSSNILSDLNAGKIVPVTISTDDCGMYDGELFDTGCPQGQASIQRFGTVLVVVAERFETAKSYAPKSSRPKTSDVLTGITD